MHEPRCTVVQHSAQSERHSEPVFLLPLQRHCAHAIQTGPLDRLHAPSRPPCSPPPQLVPPALCVHRIFRRIVGPHQRLPHMKAYTSASVGSVVFACWEEQAGSCDANSRGRLLVAHVHRWEGVAAMGRVAPRVAGCAHRRLARHAPVPHCAITKEGGARTHQGARSGVRQADRCSSGAKAGATWRSHPIGFLRRVQGRGLRATGSGRRAASVLNEPMLMFLIMPFGGSFAGWSEPSPSFSSANSSPP